MSSLLEHIRLKKNSCNAIRCFQHAFEFILLFYLCHWGALCQQVDQILTMVFQKLIRQNRGKQLIDMLEFLDSQLYCHLDASYEPTIRKLEVLFELLQSPRQVEESLQTTCK